MLDQVFEGKFRPGHFQGVCQVVNRLLDIVKPVNLYMGQKDYQQCMVIKKLLVITGRDTKLHICETVREPGGLAMSSRNMRLSEEEKISARAIFNALQYCQQHFKTDNLARVQQGAKEMLMQNGFRIDYLEFAHALDLQPIDEWKGEPVVVLVAAFMNDVDSSTIR
jgi:pantoate--beta-alanine ligase